MLEEILIKKTDLGISKRIIHFNSEEDYKTYHPSEVETYIPTIKDFKHSIIFNYDKSGTLIREEHSVAGTKYFYRKTIVYEYHNNVCLKHIIIERNRSATYDIEYLISNQVNLPDLNHGFKKKKRDFLFQDLEHSFTIYRAQN